MQRRIRTTPIAMAVLVVALITACSGEDEVPVEFRETPVLVGQESHALVTERYARFHQGPDLMAPVVAHGRAGDVLEVMGSTADREWTELQTSTGRGWVQSIHIRRFSSRLQAVNAKRLLDEQDGFR